MTDQEFATWDRHKAENLQLQRDDALERLNKLEEEHAALQKEAHSLRLENAERKQKMDAMESHPDVVAARKQKLLERKQALEQELARLE